MTTLTANQESRLIEIKNICSSNRFLSDRFKALSEAGFTVSEFPMPTGGGLGYCKQMKNRIRVRVSANWGGRKGNYANCVHI